MRSCRGVLYKGVGESSSRVNKRNLKYKLERYQINFPKFVYGSPTSIEA